MSIRRIGSRVAEVVVKSLDRNQRGATHWLPVLHVEQLDVDCHRQEVVNFSRKFNSLTGKRLMATVMTPRSPIVRDRLSRDAFDAERYVDAIASIAEHADIGLHGHFLRDCGWPQHSSFFQLESIRTQVRDEVSLLREQGFLSKTPLAYSAGWWFMVPALQKVLVEEGFQLDFSLSASRENFSVASYLARGKFEIGERTSIRHDDRQLVGAFALASTNRSDSQYLGLLKAGAHRWHGLGQRYLTLYSHDYDLDCDRSMAGIDRLARDGFSFFQAAELLA